MKPNVTTAKLAAAEKGCTYQAIYNALDAGRLTEAKIGGMRLVLLDKKYREYTVRETGGRTHKD